MAEDEVAEDEKPQGSSKKKLLILGSALALVVGAIGVGAGMFLSGGGEGSGETNASEVSGAAESKSDSEAEGSESGDDLPDGEKTEDSKKEDVKAEGGDAGASGADGEAAGDAKAEGEQSDGEDDGPDINFGKTYKLKSFHLNLGNPLENRYIRLEVAIEFGGGEAQAKEIKSREPQLRDAVISIVTRKSREFLLAPDGKDQLRREIKTRINRYMNKPIESVFITDLLIE